MSFDENLQTARMKSAAAGERDGFTFDRVFPMATQQNEGFDYGVKECVMTDAPWTRLPIVNFFNFIM